VAEKYKGKADAPDKLFTYLKSGGKQSDGDDHKQVKAGDADIKALVQVVLSSK
jgi:cytochrome c551/c552